MLNIEPIIIKANLANAEKDGDYKKDGLLYCGKCHTKKQTQVTFNNNTRIVGCTCKCRAEQIEKERAEEKEREYLDRIHRLKINGIADKEMRDYTFSNDNGNNPKMIDVAMRYTSKWEKMYKDNIGLLFWGNTGNGKTYTAACIANELIEKGIPVLMTSFPKIINSLTGMYAEERTAYLDSISNFKLLVIDDLGTERHSEFALEQVYTVIDTRYKNKQPIIITTNLTLAEMKNPQNMEFQRIYDRVLEMCVPIQFKGESMRKDLAQNKIDRARALLTE